MTTTQMRVAVLGARGYLGRELIRLLLQHPHVDTILPASSSTAGDPIGASVPGLRHTDMPMVAQDGPEVRDADVVFMATGHGEAKRLMPVFDEAGTKLVIDLSRDHRLQAQEGDGWTYALADLQPPAKGTKRIANPGCYPTASISAVYPALKEGVIGDGPIIVDGKSGVSGAGGTPRADLHYSATNENTRAYKVLGHDHLAEIRGACGHLDAEGTTRPLRFTPHLVPQTRGLLATVYAPTEVSGTPLKKMYQDAYQDAAFIDVVDEPETADVRMTNRVSVAVDVDEEAGLLVARAAIDNLCKGGSGQAIQNMNHCLGIPETTGLMQIGGTP